MNMNFERDIEDFDWVFFDLETTGLDVVIGDSICEIGAFKFSKREVVGKFHSLVNPGRSVPKEAFYIHKISEEELKDSPSFEDIQGEFTSFFSNCVIFAYNVAFDMGFIDHQLKRINLQPLNLPAIDILSMARDALKLPRYNLESVARHFSIDCSNRFHRAMDDAMAAYKIFFKLIDVFKERKVDRLDYFISLYGFNNDILREKENRKILLFKEAIDKSMPLRIKVFSSMEVIEENQIIPLRMIQESGKYYLLYQRPKAESSRIPLNRILAADVLSGQL